MPHKYGFPWRTVCWKISTLSPCQRHIVNRVGGSTVCQDDLRLFYRYNRLFLCFPLSAFARTSLPFRWSRWLCKGTIKWTINTHTQYCCRPPRYECTHFKPTNPTISPHFPAGLLVICVVGVIVVFVATVAHSTPHGVAALKNNRGWQPIIIIIIIVVVVFVPRSSTFHRS